MSISSIGNRLEETFLSSKKRILSSVVAVIVLLSVPITLSLIFQQQDLRQRAASSDPACNACLAQSGGLYSSCTQVCQVSNPPDFGTGRSDNGSDTGGANPACGGAGQVCCSSGGIFGFGGTCTCSNGGKPQQNNICPDLTGAISEQPGGNGSSYCSTNTQFASLVYACSGNDILMTLRQTNSGQMATSVIPCPSGTACKIGNNSCAVCEGVSATVPSPSPSSSPSASPQLSPTPWSSPSPSPSNRDISPSPSVSPIASSPSPSVSPSPVQDECDVTTGKPNGCACDSAALNQNQCRSHVCDSATNSCRDSATSPTDTLISLKLFIPGVGGTEPGNNLNPNDTKKRFSVNIYSPSTASSTPIASTTQELEFGKGLGGVNNKGFGGTLNLGNVQTGNYIAKIKTDNALWKQLPGFVKLNQATSSAQYELALITGDLNQDNKMGVEDYNLFLSCYQGTSACSGNLKMLADLNNDGKVDLKDLNILLRAFANREGD